MTDVVIADRANERARAVHAHSDSQTHETYSAYIDRSMKLQG